MGGTKMKKTIMYVCLLVVLMTILMGCGKGQPFDTYQGEECCRDHGGGGVCTKVFKVLPNGRYGLEDTGHVTCEGRNADGTNYQCPGECK
jgi:hypothetical protein